MTQIKRLTIKDVQDAIRAGKTTEEIALMDELAEATALLRAAFAAMTPTTACQSVAYSDVSRYLDEITNDYLREDFEHDAN